MSEESQNVSAMDPSQQQAITRYNELVQLAEEQLALARDAVKALKDGMGVLDDDVESYVLGEARDLCYRAMDASTAAQNATDSLPKAVRWPLISRAEEQYREAMSLQRDAEAAAARAIVGVSSYGDLAAVLRSLREHADFNLEQLAEKIESKRSTLNHYETGHSRPDLERILKWADACGYQASISFRPKTSIRLAERLAEITTALPRRDQELLLRIAMVLKELLVSKENSSERTIVHKILLALDDAIGQDTIDRDLFKETRWDLPDQVYWRASESPVKAADLVLRLYNIDEKRDPISYARGLRMLLGPTSETDRTMFIFTHQKGAITSRPDGMDETKWEQIWREDARVRWEDLKARFMAVGVKVPEMERRDPFYDRLWGWKVPEDSEAAAPQLPDGATSSR